MPITATDFDVSYPHKSDTTDAYQPERVDTELQSVILSLLKRLYRKVDTESPESIFRLSCAIENLISAKRNYNDPF